MEDEEYDSKMLMDSERKQTPLRLMDKVRIALNVRPKTSSVARKRRPNDQQFYLGQPRNIIG